MNKKTTPTPSPWDDVDLTDTTPVEHIKEDQAAAQVRAVELKKTSAVSPNAPQFDLEGLMSDFPTATELERFVYDQTGIVLNLKGRAQKLKYQVAMDALNGKTVDEVYIGTENPYVDRAELVPEEPIKPVPARDPSLPPADEVQNTFLSRFIPHPDQEYRARDVKVDVEFKKYNNGMISYEVLGPIEPKPIGEKMDKWGKMRPEYISWIDPRTGEQVAVRKDGTLTPLGRALRMVMQGMKVNKTNQWEVWVDRELISVDDGALNNPWDLKE